VSKSTPIANKWGSGFIYIPYELWKTTIRVRIPGYLTRKSFMIYYKL